MDRTYTEDFYKEASKFTQDFLMNPENHKQFSIKVDGEFRDPPVVIIGRAMQEGMNYSDQLLLTKHCILNKQVRIYLDGEEIGGLQLNEIKGDLDFELFPVFKEYPMALNILIDTCIGFITKKYVPPLKSIPQTEAEPLK